MRVHASPGAGGGAGERDIAFRRGGAGARRARRRLPAAARPLLKFGAAFGRAKAARHGAGARRSGESGAGGGPVPGRSRGARPRPAERRASTRIGRPGAMRAPGRRALGGAALGAGRSFIGRARKGAEGIKGLSRAVESGRGAPSKGAPRRSLTQSGPAAHRFPAAAARAGSPGPHGGGRPSPAAPRVIAGRRRAAAARARAEARGRRGARAWRVSHRPGAGPGQLDEGG